MTSMEPLQNTKLYGLESYHQEITGLYDKKILPTKILLSGKRGIGKSTLAYHIVNYILSKDEDYEYNQDNNTINNLNKSFKLIQNKCHPNFHLIDLLNDKKIIDVGQVRTAITYANKSNFNDKPRFILIDNVENLNKNSTNALLKIVEEPNNNIFFILIHNDQKNILSTLKSRCLTFKINLNFNEVIKITNSILNEDIHQLINIDLINFYSTPGEFIKLINFSVDKKVDLKETTIKDLLNLLIDSGYYKKNLYIKELLISFIELYFLRRYKLSNTKNSLIKTYHNFIYKVHNTYKYNLDEESLFLEFKIKLLNE